MGPIQIENAYADSLALNDLLPWSLVRPRSLSILPIASACQARCDFCFSHSSVSDDQKQSRIDLRRFEECCAKSIQLGAERLVITGGGEPTILSHSDLLDLIRVGKQFFDRIVMITNGYHLGQASSVDRKIVLQDYEEAGVTVLSISRHSNNRRVNAEIMKLDIDSESIAEAALDSRLKLRWICVLQLKGVHDETTLRAYLDWVSKTGVKEVCFKELYVAAMNESVYHDSKYNDWCRRNQVPMRLVLDFLVQNQARKVTTLPWGAPIFVLKWRAQELTIAVYTEPSVYWERSNGICRSWNLMADGTCYANLETKRSMLAI